MSNSAAKGIGIVILMTAAGALSNLAGYYLARPIVSGMSPLVRLEFLLGVEAWVLEICLGTIPGLTCGLATGIIRLAAVKKGKLITAIIFVVIVSGVLGVIIAPQVWL